MASSIEISQEPEELLASKPTSGRLLESTFFVWADFLMTPLFLDACMAIPMVKTTDPRHCQLEKTPHRLVPECPSDRDPRHGLGHGSRFDPQRRQTLSYPSWVR